MSATEEPDRYNQERKIAESDDKEGRLTLARNDKTHLEILYYLAEHDPDPFVRKAVVENKSLPVQASTVLAKDDDDEVRLALAQRLVELLPDVTETEHSKLYAFVVQALGDLALDKVINIRKALSSALKDHAHTPPKVAGQLARDVEREVSEPILRFCTALSDEDLIDILRKHPEDWVVAAVADREEVSEEVSELVIETESRPGGKTLIENEGAQISRNLLQIIVDKAKSFPEWQSPIAVRKTLPTDIAKQLAEFAHQSVKDLLTKRDDFDKETIDEITEVFSRRLSVVEENAGDDFDNRPLEWAKKTKAKGTLSEQSLLDAKAMYGNDFLRAGLAEMLETDLRTVEKIFLMRSAKAIVALCWKANLSMRFAFKMQQDPGKIHHSELIYPRDGTDYPLTEEDLTLQVELIGL